MSFDIEFTPEEEYLLEGKRKMLVRELKKKGIVNTKVLDAINKIPRHIFFDLGSFSYDKASNKLKSEGHSLILDHAYSDRALPIGRDQTISHPYTVAFQTQQLDIQQNDKVLEIGTGSGYQTAVLLELGASVFSVERIKELHLKSIHLLKSLKYKNYKLLYGDGYQGWSEFAPYDKIIVTAAAPNIPEKLLLQLKENGKMIIPIGDDKFQEMFLFTRGKDSTFTKEKLGAFSFVPMLKDKN